MRDARVEGAWPWILQRVTALALLCMLGIHMLVTHFQHPPPLTFEQVEARFRVSPTGWFWFDFLFLLVALFHGLNGIRIIVYDFRPSRPVQLAVTGLLWAVGLGAAVAGHIILLPYYHAGK